MKETPIYLLPLIALLFVLQSCGDDPYSNRRIEYTPPEPFDLSTAKSDTTTPEGLQIYVIEEGNGRDTLMFRDQAAVKYTGRKKKDGDVFDSSFRNGSTSPSIFRNLTSSPKNINGRRVEPLIEGFRLGIIQELNSEASSPLEGMVAGEKRVIIIPPKLGYGEKQEDDNSNRTGKDLRGETLRFDIELIGIQ